MVWTGALSKHNVAHKLYKQSLLNAVCIVAGISIFFFGYDQGLMGGVNTNRNYAELMGFGYFDEQQGSVVVTKPLLQGSIVRLSFPVLPTRMPKKKREKENTAED
jgi:hypothetical protein